MAVSTKLIQVRPNPRLNTFRSFSSSSAAPTSPPHSDDKPHEPEPEPDSRSQLTSYFSDVKSTLKQSQQLNPPFRPAIPRPVSFPPPNSSISPPPKLPSLEEIGKTLSGFRHRSLSPLHGPQSPSAGTHISFQDILQKNVNSKPQVSSSFNDGKSGTNIAFNAIRESLSKFKLTQTNPKLNSSLSEYQDSLKLRPSNDRGMNNSHVVIGGTDAFPFSVFGKELKEKGDAEYIPALKTELVKYYTVRELGEKLRLLRPEKKGDKKDWFSLDELNERLVKLREMDLEEGNNYDKLRSAVRTWGDQEKKKNLQKLDMLSHLGRTPSFMLEPPKEELVEKFFHPDNMSASEKLKLQLEKVREEFKMSETDCGSSRVQVAQLTTKINHLAGVLHKKDKHSRKGLQAMLQKRKSLLKYLRRTDWESYCFVLSRLGLRDNPDAKR